MYHKLRPCHCTVASRPYLARPHPWAGFFFIMSEASVFYSPATIARPVRALAGFFMLSEVFRFLPDHDHSRPVWASDGIGAG